MPRRRRAHRRRQAAQIDAVRCPDAARRPDAVRAPLSSPLPRRRQAAPKPPSPPPLTPSSSPAPVIAVVVAHARRRRRCGEAPRRLPRPVHPRGRSSAAAPIPAGDLDPSPRCEPLPPPLSFSLRSPHAIRKRHCQPSSPSPTTGLFFVFLLRCMYDVHCIMLCICCIMLVFAFFCYQEKGLFFGDMYVHMLINI